jgi:hypothetical protein
MIIGGYWFPNPYLMFEVTEITVALGVAVAAA